MKYREPGTGGTLSSSAAVTWSEASGVTESTLSVQPVGALSVAIAAAVPIGAGLSRLEPGGGGGAGIGTKTARTDLEAVSSSAHLAPPVQAPLHRPSSHPAAARAVRRTLVLWAKRARHAPGHDTPAGELVTLPFPVTATVRACLEDDAATASGTPANTLAIPRSAIFRGTVASYDRNFAT
jgi:hypothetical protein